MLRKLLIALALLGGGATPAVADERLYLALGEQAGIRRLVVDFVDRLYLDARLAPFFKDASRKNLVEQLGDQFCSLAGGPCRYEGGAMRAVHRDMNIGKGDFNALVELLQDAMEAADIPFATQNRLLARLAPLHRDIVNRP